MNDLKLHPQMKQLYFILYPAHRYILLFFRLARNHHPQPHDKDSSSIVLFSA